uniref:Uncharacterized protein n=1 Tax=Thalassionema nitzschioides TaxID=33649 RepID=A0A7S1H4W6_9STRA
MMNLPTAARSFLLVIPCQRSPQTHTFMNRKLPQKNSKQRVALTPKTPLMSPPLPSKIKMNSSMHISPLHQSPALNANDWPSWARDELQKETLSPSMRSKQNLMNDSLAFSADSNFSNPFARKIGKGTLSSPLAGIKFLDDKSLR